MRIVVVGDSYGEIVAWCRNHNFDIHKDVYYIYEKGDMNKLYEIEIQSVVFLPSFYSLPFTTQVDMLNMVASRMRLSPPRKEK